MKIFERIGSFIYRHRKLQRFVDRYITGWDDNPETKEFFWERKRGEK